MNIQSVIEIANKKMGPSNEIGNGVFKGSILIDDKQAGTYFIDFSERADHLPFSSYQEDLLAEEYYRSKEELQWNIYLFLLRDHVDQEAKRIIEKDERYARKYLLREDEFSQFFDVVVSENVIEYNLIDGWKEELNRVGTDVLRVDADAKEIIKIVTEGTSKELKSKKLVVRKPDFSTLKSINNIQFNGHFRKFPTGWAFEFKKVNLFKGINGAGKTSTLEAIELAVCGKNFSNLSVNEKDGCLKVKFNNSPEWHICKPSMRDTFRQREKEWYNTVSTRSNDMCISFNRFNYFNADAAYIFANAKSVEESRSALYNIILGPEYDLLLNKAHKMLEEIRPEYNRLLGEREVFVTQKKENDKKINDWKPKESLRKLAVEIDADLRKIGFIEEIPSILEDHVYIETRLEKINCYLTELVEYEVDGPQSVDKWKEDYNRNILLSKTLDELRTELLELGDKNNKLKGELELLESCVVYFNNPALFLLEGVGRRIKDLERMIAWVEHTKNLLNRVDFDKYLGSMTLECIISQIQKSVSSKKNEKNILNEKFQKEVARLGKMKEMINQVRVHGKAIIDYEPNMANCPLCDSAINRSQLLEKLLSYYNQEEYEEDLDALQQSIMAYDKDIENLDNEYSQLVNLQNAIKFRNLEPSISISRVIAEFLFDIESVDIFREQLKDENRRVYFGAQYDVSEASLNELTEMLKKKYPDCDFSVENRSYFIDQMPILNHLIQSNDDRRQAIRSELALYSIRLLEEKKSFVDLDYWDVFNEVNRATNEMGSKVKIVEDVLGKLKLIIKLGNSKYTDLLFDLDLISSKISIYRDELKLELELEEARKGSAEMGRKLKDGEEKFLGYKDAFETLDRIKKNPADDNVKKFFDQHMEEVMDVFQSIHVPREFKRIMIRHGDIILVDLNDKERKVTQISTGQRSALAIAIFLTLNRSLKKGPDVIIFDDPMAFVDDLNALSFLDYLRFFVLKENKQIFFATANMKLANLFKRKFQFLGIGEGYQEWDLDRAGIGVTAAL